MPVSSVTEHWIRQDALTINLNHFGDPDYLQVSLLAGAVVMAFKQDVIGYNAAHNYRTWPLEAANTYLETTSPYHVYARLTRSEVNARALVVYDTKLRDIEGREITYDTEGREVLGGPNADYFFIYLGKISSSLNSSGNSVSRTWDTSYNAGTLNTNQYQMEETQGEWTKMFRLNKVTDMIDVLKRFSSAIFQKLFIGEKAITDIKRSTDDDVVVPISDTSLPTTAYLDNRLEGFDDRYLRKDQDDTASGNITFKKQIKSDDFKQGNLTGSGWAVYRNANGNTVIETDNLVVRQGLTVNELVVNQETFSKGSTIYVKGGCTITKVEEFDEFYRCYYDNEGKSRLSGFKYEDQARCQRYDKSYENVVKYYWRLVVGVGDDYVDLSKADADGEGVPEVGDDIAQFGHRTDKTRQSAIVISPDNGGSVSILAGLSSFKLDNNDMIGMGVNPHSGRAYLYGYGDMYFGDRNLEGNFITYQIKEGDTEPTLVVNADIQMGAGSTGLKNLTEFKEIQKDVNNLQGQIENEFTIWFFDDEPTLENEPAVDWVTDALKADHDQDLYYSDKLARAWRFVSGEWVEITDERTLAALKIAEEAESKAKEASNYVNNVLPGTLSDLQKQIDGAVDSYFHKYDPTLENEPASLWVTDEQKEMHLSDTFTNIGSGRSWEWSVSEGVYGWLEIEDTATLKALQDASNAQYTADGKRRVFVKTPTVPYDEGDLWVQGSTGDILRCATPKKEDESYAESDWVKASKYTDDSALNTFLNGDYKEQLKIINQQIDERAETWYQEEDPSLAWNTEDLKQLHVGDLWYDTTREQSFMWNGSEWITQGVPDEVFNKINGKASIYTSQPSSYSKNDLWFLMDDTELDKAYKAGTIVIATETSDVFVKGHWTKRDNYTDDTLAEEAYDKAVQLELKSQSYDKAIEGLGVDMEIVKQQTDREFTIWYGEEEPTLNNEPAVNWVTEADKNMHDQDIFYADNLGMAWRFVNGEWVEITDARTIAALEKADEAYEKASEAEKVANDLIYLKSAFGKDEKVFEGGIIMGDVVGVINDSKEVEAMINGSDFAKDDTHGKLMLASGIPQESSDKKTELDARAKEAATRIYEDGHLKTNSAEIEGTLTVKKMMHKTLVAKGGLLEGYSMGVAIEDGTTTASNTEGDTPIDSRLFVLPDVSDGSFMEVRVVWFNTANVQVEYMVNASGKNVINYKENYVYVKRNILYIQPDTFYRFFSVNGEWYVSTENILNQ